MRAAWPGPGLSPCALRFPSWDLPQTLPSVFPHCRPIKDPPGHTGSIVVLSLVDHAKPSCSGTRAVRSTAHAVCCRALCCSGPPRGEGSGDSLLRRSANAPASCSRRGTCCLQTPKHPPSTVLPPQQSVARRDTTVIPLLWRGYPSMPYSTAPLKLLVCQVPESSPGQFPTQSACVLPRPRHTLLFWSC